MNGEIWEPVLILTGREAAEVSEALRLGLLMLTDRYGGVPERATMTAGRIRGFAEEFRNRQRRVRRSEAGSGTKVAQRAMRLPVSSAKDWLSTQEVAEALGVSDSFVRRLAKRRRFVARQAGRGAPWLCDAASVAAWAAGRNSKTA